MVARMPRCTIAGLFCAATFLGMVTIAMVVDYGITAARIAAYDAACLSLPIGAPKADLIRALGDPPNIVVNHKSSADTIPFFYTYHIERRFSRPIRWEVGIDINGTVVSKHRSDGYGC